MQTNNITLEKILNHEIVIHDQTPCIIRKFIRCTGQFIEAIEGRVKLAYVRCPKCKEYISIYHDEIQDNGITRKPKKCLCGFFKRLELKDW